MDDLLTEFVVVVVTSVITTLCASALHWRKVKADLVKEYESRFNEKKWGVYIGFTSVLDKLFRWTRAESQKQSEMKRIINELGSFASQLMIVGSDEVFDAYNVYVRASRGDASDTRETFEALSQVIIAMRKDLGYESTKIDAKALMTPFTLDVDDLFGKE